MLSKISEISGNRYREAKQSHMAVHLSSKCREKRIHNPAPLRPTNGQNVDGIRSLFRDFYGKALTLFF